MEQAMTRDRFLQETYLRIFLSMPQNMVFEEAAKVSWETSVELARLIPVEWKKRFGW